MEGNAKNMDSVFDLSAEDELNFDTIFGDEEDSLIDTVNGIKEDGSSLLGGEYEFVKEEDDLVGDKLDDNSTDNDDNKVDIEGTDKPDIDGDKALTDKEEDVKADETYKESVDLDDIFLDEDAPEVPSDGDFSDEIIEPTTEGLCSCGKDDCPICGAKVNANKDQEFIGDKLDDNSTDNDDNKVDIEGTDKPDMDGDKALTDKEDSVDADKESKPFTDGVDLDEMFIDVDDNGNIISESDDEVEDYSDEIYTDDEDDSMIDDEVDEKCGESVDFSAAPLLGIEEAEVDYAEDELVNAVDSNNSASNTNLDYDPAEDEDIIEDLL